MATLATVTLRNGPQSGEAVYTASVRLQDGQVTLAGKFFFVPANQTFKAAVTGGTQAYRDARGYAVFRQVSGSTTIVTLYVLP